MIGLLLISSWALRGQWDHSLPMMKDNVLRTMSNPASTTDHDWFIGGGFGFRFEHSGNGIKDVWTVEDRTLIFNTDEWVRKLDDHNEFFSDSEIQTFLVGGKLGKFRWTFGHAFRNNIYTNYSKGLAEFIHFGNANYVGETMDLGFSTDWMSYSTLHAGLSWEIKNISIGARLHYLSGAQWLSTDPGDLSLFTNEEFYQLEFQSDLQIRSSSFISAEDIGSLQFEFSGVEAYKWFSKNHGLALDLGAEYRLGSQLEAEVSILDLGAIRWVEVNDYTTSPSFTFEGINFGEISDLDSLDFDEALDSLEAMAGVTESIEENVLTNLNPRMMIGLHWTPNDRWRVSGLFMSHAVQGNAYNTVALGVQYAPFKWWKIGANVAHRKHHTQFGFHTMADIAFVQLFFATDHVPALFSLNDLGNSGVRFGGALVF